MKKLISLILALTFILSLAACAPASDNGTDDTAADNSVNDGSVINDTNDGTVSDEPDTPPEDEPEEEGYFMEPVKWDDDGELNVLNIGNSFGDDTLYYFREIALSAGIEKVNIFHLQIGGTHLADHAKNAREDAAVYFFQNNLTGRWNQIPNFKMSNGLQFKKWDVVSINSGSNTSGDPASFADLDFYVGYIRGKVGPDTKIIWNMTWAYQQDYAPGSSGYERFADFNNSQETMYNAIVETTKSVVLENSEIYGVVSTGTAIQNARSSFLGDTLTRDGYHLNFLTGRYTAGLTYFGAIVGAEYLDNVTFMPAEVQFHGGIIEDEAPVSMDEKTQIACIEAAKNAVAKPFEVTHSQYTA